MLVSILGLVLQDDQRREEVIDWIEGLVPLSEEANIDLANTIDGLATPLSAAGFAALLVLLWSASGLAASLQTALNRIWQEHMGKAVVLVTHGGVIQASFAYFFNLSATTIPGILTENTAITHWTRATDANRWTLQRHNDHAHLQATT